LYDFDEVPALWGCGSDDRKISTGHLVSNSLNDLRAKHDCGSGEYRECDNYGYEDFHGILSCQ